MAAASPFMVPAACGSANSKEKLHDSANHPTNGVSQSNVCNKSNSDGNLNEVDMALKADMCRAENVALALVDSGGVIDDNRFSAPSLRDS